MKRRLMTVGLLGLGLVSAPVFAAETARPGTVNYVEGAAAIDGQPLNSNQVGSLNLDPGQELTTSTGKAEILLTPGVFLRVGSDSAVKMISPDLTLTQVEVEKGRASVEVDQIYAQNNLQIIDAGVTTQLQKTGFYEFNAEQPELMVYKGKAVVDLGSGRTREVKEHHDFMLAGGRNGQQVAKEKPVDFNTGSSRDDLYNWSSLRSEYLAQANSQMATQYAPDGYYPGWYWDPYTVGYTFIGGGPFYSPFGWGFYPFGWGGGFYGGYYGRGYGHYGREHGVYSRGGFAEGNRSFAGRGFHGGGGYGGGFHGGGGGFHGGGGFSGGGRR